MFPYANAATPATCDVFFKCTETLNPDGSGSIVDSIRGATWTPSVGGVGYTITNETARSNSVYSVAASPQTLSAGSWPDFGLRSIILFACGRVIDPTTVRAPIGDGQTPPAGAGGLISLSCGGGMHAIINSDSLQLSSSGTHSGLALPVAGDDVGLIVEYTPKVGTLAKIVDLNGNPFGSGATATVFYTPSVIATDYTVNPGLNNKTRFGGLAFYSIAAFSFSAELPSNRENAYRWMLSNHSAGVRKLPPQWSYRTP